MSLLFVYDHRIMIFALAPAFLAMQANRISVTRNLPADTPEIAAQNEEDLRAIEGIMI